MKIFRPLLPLLLLCFSPLALAADHPASLQKDVETIRERLMERYLPNSPEALHELITTVNDYMTSLQSDGSWAEVDYSCKDRCSWKSARHLSRLRSMCSALAAQESPLQDDPALKEACLKALDYWYAGKYRNPNWWWNEIGAQLTLGPSLLLLDEALSPDQRAQGIEIMKRSKWKKWTGQNLVWGVTIQIMRGCFEQSPPVIQEAYEAMYTEIKIAAPGKEGIQVDFSFHQHGPQLYSGGYGRGFASNSCEFIYHARGTSFAPSKGVVKTMKGYLLDGLQWMMRGLVLDHSIIGREITRPGRSGAQAILTAATRLAELGGKRKRELDTFVQRMRSNGLEAPLTGNRHFWRSDYTAHHRPDYFVSIRTASSRNRRSEVTNREGRKSHHLADGAMLLYQDGQEYIDIFPVWDWQRIPGVTCEQMDWAKKGKVGGLGERGFVGGVSDGNYGMAAMDFKREALSAKKAWFCFDEAVVCLGADISCENNNPVLSSVNQCLLRGQVSIADSDAPLEQSLHHYESATWVHHDQVGYVFPQAAKLHLSNQPQTGQWSDIGTNTTPVAPTEVFSLWLGHGQAPQEADYAYLVYPNISPETLSERAKNSSYEILTNTGQIQAVRDIKNKVIQIAFWEAASLSYDADQFLRVDKPCLVQLHEKKSTVSIAIANPRNTRLTVKLESSLGLTGAYCKALKDGATRITLVLPEEEYAGSSLVRKYRKRTPRRRK